MNNSRHRLLVFAAACFAAPAFSQTSGREYDDIERQPIADALADLSQQTGLRVTRFAEQLQRNSLVAPLGGRYTAEAAVAQLLLGSGFSFEQVDERTISITGQESTRVQRALPATEQSAPSPQSFVHQVNLRLAESTPSDDSNKVGGASANAITSDVQRVRTLETVTVTAQKRVEKLQDVPISMTVFNGGDLDKSTVIDVTETLRRVPGVSLYEGAYGGVTQVPVRGVASAGSIDGGPSATAYYLDAVPFGFVRSAFAPTPDAYDLDRVEVLRGPQGTLYGANALNGVVRVLTKDANPDKLEFKARGLTSSTEGGGGNYRGDMALNVPVIAGKLAARAVLGYQNWSGWIDRPNEKDANDAERRNMRLKINAQPTEALSIGLSAWVSRSDVGAPSSGDDNGRNSSLFDEPISTDYDAYGLTIGYEDARFSLTSLTSYLDFSNNLDLDSGERGVPEAPHTNIVETFAAETFTQEVAINSVAAKSWRWSAGAMYRDSKDLDDADLLALFPTPAITHQYSKSHAIFGELPRLFLDGQWELTAGLRYFEDEVTQRRASNWTPPAPGQPTTVADTFSATTPRFVLTWHPSGQLTAYASYSEGFRSGYHQFPYLTTSFPPVKPDHLTNYELGSKGSVFAGRLAFDTAVYFIDWKDIQQSLQVPVNDEVCCVSAGVNGTSASGVGVDFGVTVAPTDALELGLNFSWNDLASDDKVFTRDTAGNPVLLFDKGDRINFSTEYTAGASATYSAPVGRNGFEWRASIAADYTSEQPERILQGDEVVTTAGGPLLIGRASVSVEAPSGWTASFFVDNFNNESNPSSRPTTGPDFWMRVRPRTIGAQIEYRL